MVERASEESSSFFGSYRLSGSPDKGSVSGFHYIIAESELRGGRRHRRVIADEPSEPLLHGKPLFYMDAYLVSGQDTTYVYARHLVDPPQFFTALNFLLEDQKFRELVGRQHRAVFNQGGDFIERSVTFPFLDDNFLRGEVRFCRLFLPFGDVAVEFSPPSATIENELEAALRYRRVTKRLESPLLGCDLSRTQALGKLIVNTHWTSRRIPASILGALLNEVTRLPVHA